MKQKGFIGIKQNNYCKETGLKMIKTRGLQPGRTQADKSSDANDWTCEDNQKGTYVQRLTRGNKNQVWFIRAT